MSHISALLAGSILALATFCGGASAQGPILPVQGKPGSVDATVQPDMPPWNPDAWSPVAYTTVAEALQHPLPVPKYCLDAKGRNTCVPTFITDQGPGNTAAWRPASWIKPGTLNTCVDSTANRTLKCGEPGAYWVWNTPPPSLNLPDEP